MRKIILLAAIFGFSHVYSQNSTESETQFQNTPFNVGLGIGMNYGGFGANATYIVQNRVGLFLGLGYNLAGLGYNVGATYRISPDKRVTPYFLFMYGYNGVVKVTGGFEYEEIYYGPTLGFGVEIKMRNQPSNFFNLGLLVPFRDAAFQNDIDNLKSLGVDFNSEPLPIGISIGYHFGVK